jgi:tripartite ATP-independent transporter DctM subunit
MVIYGVMANASIGQLFAAGFLPGLTMGLTLMVMVFWFAHRRDYHCDVRFSVPNLWVATKRAFLPLMTPVILVGGMVTGVFTPTEAAIAATAYALVLGVCVYRSLSLKRLIKISFETIETTAIILLIVAGASIFGYLITTSKITDHVADAVLSITTQPWAVLLLVNIFLLIVGCFMETIAAITILVPVLMPLVERIGVDPVHFGVIMVLNLMIGLLTPPVGMVLYVLARVANISLDRTTKACAPFLIPLIVTLAIVTYWPSMVMLLPNLFYK